MKKVSILDYISKRKKRIAVGTMIKIAGTFAELLLPIIMAYMIDEIAPEKNIPLLITWGIIMLMCAVVAWGGNVKANRMASKVARDTTREIRNDLFSSTLYLSASQTDEVTVPSLVSRLSSDTYNLHNMIGMVQRLGIRTPILLIGGVALTFTVEPVLALVLLAIVPLLTLIVIYISSKGIVLYTSLQKAVDVMVRKVRDDYTGIRVIKALSKTEYESSDFRKINENVVSNETRAGLTMGITSPVLNMLLNLGMTAVIIVGAYRVSSGNAKVGEIIAFTSYFTIILNAVISISRIFVNISKGSASAKRISAILNMENPLVAHPELSENINSDEYIAFENVTFGYNGSPALSNVSFSVRKGESLGIIGATGSGKTTIISLLLRFYDPDSGVIRVDGRDIRSYDEKELRNKFGVVLQNDFLMADTVKENIRFERDVSDSDVESAAKYAKAHDFISATEHGYDTGLTARGTNFSGGQKQRMLIARALAAKPDILILDDASSALDYKTDAMLRKTLISNFPDTNIVMIAQRISSVRFADKIIMLDKGCVAGYGSHEELIRNCEIYREMQNTQTETEDGTNE